MRVILRPLGADPWSGVKKYRGCHDDIGTYLTRTGRLYTGLTDEDAERLGKKLGLDLSSGSEFWKENKFYIRTGARDIYFDTEDPMDELRVLFLKSHKNVKTSLLEKKAGANFVLINKDEEAKVSNVYNKAKREAFKAFDELSPTEIRKVLRLYGENADDMSAEVAEERLFSFVEADPSRFILKWINNASRETEVLLERAIGRNIIRKGSNLYKFGTEVIGRSKEEAINFLDNPKNQDIKRSIIVQMDAKDYIDNREYKSEKTNIEKILDAEPERIKKSRVKSEDTNTEE